MPPAKKAPAVRQPQDHKPKTSSRPKAKAVSNEATEPDFEFEHDGHVYSLPFAARYVQSSSGGAFMDALLDESGQSEVRLAMLALQSAKDDIEPDAFEALRDKPMADFLEVVGEWMSAAQVEPGES